VDRVLAIATQRFRLLLRRSRGVTGAVKTVAGLIMAFFATLFAAAIAAGFGALVYFAVGDGEASVMRAAFLVVFYTFFVFGVILPVLSGAMNPGFDASPLRVFPISQGRLYAITLGAGFFNSEHFLYYPALAAVCVLGVVVPGVEVPAGLTVIGLVLVFYVVWGNAITLSLTSIMRRRRAREILGIAAITIILVVSLSPAFLEDAEGNIEIESRPYLGTVMRGVVRVAAILPPSIAAEALTTLHTAGLGAANRYLLWLSAWDVAGLALGYWVFLRLHLGERGSVRRVRRKKKAPVKTGRVREHLSADNPALTFIPREVRAVAAKELRYLFRSVVGKFNLIVTPLFVVFVVFTFGRRVSGSYFGMAAEELVLFALLLYTTLFSGNFVNNAFGWEGDGIRMYFTGPAALSRVLVGKNLGVWTYNGVLLLIVIATWSVLQGLPDVSTMLSALALYGSCVLAFSTLGNLISVTFPVARDISSIRNSPSQVGILLSLVSLSVVASIVALSLLAPFALGVLWLRPLVLFVLLLLTALLYVFVLRFAAGLMDDRKEKLIESLRVRD
jgi:hypothetical protein